MQSRKKRSTGSFNTVTSCISTTLVLILLSVCISSFGYTTSATPGRLFKAGT